MTSKILKTMHETAKDFAENHLIDTQTIRKFDALCLPQPQTAAQSKVKTTAQRKSKA